MKELRGFLGLTCYYRWFIKQFVVITKLLTNLLKKGNFCWTMEATQAFEELKQVMVQAPLLEFPNFTIPFVIKVDTIGKSVWSCFNENGRPIAFTSQALSPEHLGLSTYEKELVSLLHALEKWKHYLQSSHFVIKTDHFILKSLKIRELLLHYSIRVLLSYWAWIMRSNTANG